MKKYNFLIKPVFFIFNLLFATWLVFKIEKISPSDFGKYKSLIEDSSQPIPAKFGNKEYLKKICSDYKTGKIDSVELEKQIDKFIALPIKNPSK